MQTSDNFRGLLESKERQLRELREEAARNDSKLRRSQQRQMRLLQAENLPALFRELTEGMRLSYGLQQVSLVLCDPDHDIRHLLLADGTPSDSLKDVVFVESIGGLAPQYVNLHRPWLGAYRRCDHELILSAPGLASLAILPLEHRGKLTGSLNFGSNDADRYTERHASDFLAQLAIIASYCIENVVNRARLLRSGFTDVLTGWHNRRYLQVRLKEELARASREQVRLVCLMLDIDRFKQVNDTWGHAAGDAVLREFAQRIEAEVRASDVAARYGGEEFVVLLPGTGTADGVRLAERIRHSVSAAPFELPCGERITVTVSIGVSAAMPASHARDLKTLGDSLLARADVALYDAKTEGRDRVVVARDT
jgi:two-component system, cell cycle response regulator